MTIFRPPVAMLAVLIGWMLFGSSGNAADLTAAWATDAAVCTKVFVKDGNKFRLRRTKTSTAAEL